MILAQATFAQAIFVLLFLPKNLWSTIFFWSKAHFWQQYFLALILINCTWKFDQTKNFCTKEVLDQRIFCINILLIIKFLDSVLVLTIIFFWPNSFCIIFLPKIVCVRNYSQQRIYLKEFHIIINDRTHWQNTLVEDIGGGHCASTGTVAGDKDLQKLAYSVIKNFR